MKRSREYHLINLGLTTLASLCAIFAYADNDIYPLAFAIPVLFYIVIQKRRPSKKALFWYGMYYGIFTAYGGFYWLTHTLKTFGGVPIVAAYLLFALYAAVFHLKFPVYFFILGWLRKHPFAAWLKFGSFIVVVEYFSLELFPWTIGASQYLNYSFIQSSDVLGAYGMSFLLFSYGFLVYYTYILARLIRHRKSKGFALGRLFNVRSPLYRRVSLHILAMLVIVIGNQVYGSLKLSEYETKAKAADKRTVSMIQPSAPLQPKPKPGSNQNQIRAFYEKTFRSTIDTVDQLTREAEAHARKNGSPIDLVVIPEGAFPYFSSNPGKPMGERDTDSVVELIINSERYYSYLHKKLLLLGQNLQVSLFSNEIDGNFRNKEAADKLSRRMIDMHYYNSSAMFDLNGNRHAFYHKVFLLPFGETLPFPFNQGGLERWILENTNVSSFTPGTVTGVLDFEYKNEKPDLTDEDFTSIDYYDGITVEEIQKDRTPVTADGKATFLPLICYEVLSGDFVRKFDGRQKAGFIVNVTNDRWFGDDSKESMQHLQLGIFRAIENRRPLVRSTNSGISALVMPTGEIVESSITPQAKATYRNLEVPYMPSDKLGDTFYGKYGEWFPIMLMFFWLGILLRPWSIYYKRKKEMG